MPTFSIITPLFNKERYFPATIASVLAQTTDDWEWLIVDDGSTDESLKQALSLAHNDARVRVTTQRNSGPCTARNSGVSGSKGEWLIFLDADDILEPDCLAGWLAAIAVEPDADLHAGGWTEVDPEATLEIAHHFPGNRAERFSIEELRDAAIAYAPWHPTAAIVRRKVVYGECLWDEAMNRKVTEDTVFWWRLIARLSVAIHYHTGVRYRRGTPGCRDQYLDPVKWSEGMFYALESNIKDWLALGNSLTSGQIASLVRVYESFGAEATQAGQPLIGKASFHRADVLLTHRTWNSPQGIARRLLGTRRFQLLKSLISWHKSA